MHSISSNHTFQWNRALFVGSGSSIGCPGMLPSSVIGLVLPFGRFLDPKSIRVSGSPDSTRSLTSDGAPPMLRFTDASALATAAVVELSLALKGSTDSVTIMYPGCPTARSQDIIATCDTATPSCSATEAFSAPLLFISSFPVVKTRSVKIVGTTQSHLVPTAKTLKIGHGMQYFVDACTTCTTGLTFPFLSAIVR